MARVRYLADSRYNNYRQGDMSVLLCTTMALDARSRQNCSICTQPTHELTVAHNDDQESYRTRCATTTVMHIIYDQTTYALLDLTLDSFTS